MSIAGITFNSPRFGHGVREDGHGRRQAMRALAGALAAGDLEGASSAYQALKEAGPGRRFQGTSPAAADLATKVAAVGSALDAGDLAAAQGAFDALRAAIRDRGVAPPPEMSIQPVPTTGEVSTQPVPTPGEVSTQPVGLPRVIYEVLQRLGFSVGPSGSAGQPVSTTPTPAPVPQIGAPAAAASAVVPQIGAPATGSTPAASGGATAPASGTPAAGAPAPGYSLSLSYLQVSWSYGGNSGSFTQTGFQLNVTG